MRSPGRQLRELTSRQCNDYQIQGGDIMLVPVGSLEVLGPHLPVGARCFVAEAFCRLLAEEVGGLCLPVVPFSSAPHTFDRPGSLAVPELSVNTYVRAVMDDLLATGFRRILVVTFLDYLRYYLPQEFYEDHHVAAGGIHLGEELSAQMREIGVGEDSCIAGALRVLGFDDLLEKVEHENRRLLEPASASVTHTGGLADSLTRLLRVGDIGFRYPEGAFPLPPNPALSPERGEQVLRRAAAQMKPHVASLRTYNDYLSRRTASRGMLWRGWNGSPQPFYEPSPEPGVSQ